MRETLCECNNLKPGQVIKTNETGLCEVCGKDWSGRTNMNKTPNGMKREAKDDKLNYLSYLTPETLKRYAIHMKHGEIKHGRKNWQYGGYPREEYLESAMRHLMALWAGQTDEDHASACIFNMFALMNEETKDWRKQAKAYLEGERIVTSKNTD